MEFIKVLALPVVLGLLGLFGGSYFFFATGEVAKWGRLIITNMVIAFLILVVIVKKILIPLSKK